MIHILLWALYAVAYVFAFRLVFWLWADDFGPLNVFTFFSGLVVAGLLACFLAFVILPIAALQAIDRRMDEGGLDRLARVIAGEHPAEKRKRKQRERDEANERLARLERELLDG